MENTKRARKENREPQEIRAGLEAARAKHYIHIEAIDRKLKALDEPRAPRGRKSSISGIMKAAKSELSRDEMIAILEAALEQKRRMGAE